jgi:hypothetical protein
VVETPEAAWRAGNGIPNTPRHMAACTCVATLVPPHDGCLSMAHTMRPLLFYITIITALDVREGPLFLVSLSLSLARARETQQALQRRYDPVGA